MDKNFFGNIVYFFSGLIIGTALSGIASYYYIDSRIKDAEKRYDQQVQQGFSNAEQEIRNGVDKISNELEQRINEEINKVRKQFGLPEESIK